MVKKAVQARPNLLLRTARKERGWTQQYVADPIGVPLVLNVTRWERVTARLSAHYIEKLCQLFDKTAFELRLVDEEEQALQVGKRSLADAQKIWIMRTDYPSTVANTWELSFLRVQQANEMAGGLLRLCAFLDPDSIPKPCS